MEVADNTLLMDHQITGAICDLIQASQERCIIISPYVKIWGHAGAALRRAATSGAMVEFFVRVPDDEKSGKLEAIEEEVRSVCPGAGLYFVPRLHAKLFINESRAILGSMNFYEFSAANSREIAMEIRDQRLLAQFYRQIDAYRQDAQTIRAGGRGNGFLKSARAFVEAAREPHGLLHHVLGDKGAQKGSCIRCKLSLAYNPSRPLCPDCYRAWSRYSNPDYVEEVCHRCGRPSDTTIARPLCRSCYRKETRAT